jgi:hypothetical protein
MDGNPERVVQLRRVGRKPLILIAGRECEDDEAGGDE